MWKNDPHYIDVDEVFGEDGLPESLANLEPEELTDLIRQAVDRFIEQDEEDHILNSAASR